MKPVAIVLFAILATSAVSAQEEPTSGVDEVASHTPADEDEARALFAAGEVAYNQGNYERALSYFEQAYALANRPALLFNIGSAAERIRHDEKAIDAYERYLAAVPDAPNRRAVLSRLEILRRHRSSSQGPTAPAPVATESAAAEVTPDTAVSSDHTLNPWGWAVLAGAGVALGIAVGGLVWWLDRQDATDECETPGFFCENRSTIDGEQTAALGTWIGGSVLFAGAAVAGLLVLLSGESDEDLAVVGDTSCGLGFGVLTCRGSF